jgi:hypothetical protein
MDSPLARVAAALGCTTKESCKAACDANLGKCIDLSQTHKAYSTAEAQLAQSYKKEVLEKLSGVRAEEFEETVITIAEALVKAKPTLARQLAVTTTQVEAAKAIVTEVRGAGVDLSVCSRPADTLAREELVKCLEASKKLAAKAEIVKAYVPEERLARVDGEAELQAAILRGEYRELGTTMEELGAKCLRPGSPAVCDEIARRFFGPEGVKMLAEARAEVGKTEEYYKKAVGSFTLTTPEGHTITGKDAIHDACEEAFRGRNIPLARACGEFAVKNGFATQKDMEEGLKFLETVVTRPEVNFDHCRVDPQSCEQFLPEDAKKEFGVMRQIEEVMRAEIGLRPQECDRGELDPAIGNRCFEGSKRALPKLEALAATSAEARRIVAEIRGHVAAEEARESARRQVEQKFATRGGPGGCRSEEACRAYCADPAHSVECLSFGAEQGIFRAAEVRTRYETYAERLSVPSVFIPPGVGSEPFRYEVSTTTVPEGMPYPGGPGQPPYQPGGQTPVGYPGAYPYYPPPPPSVGGGVSPECLAAIQAGDFARAKKLCRTPSMPVPPVVCQRYYPPCPEGQYRQYVGGPSSCPDLGECVPYSPVPPVPDQCPAYSIPPPCPQGQYREGKVMNGCPVPGECVPVPGPPAPPPQPNASVTVKQLFPGQYNNTKYALTVRDPEGIKEFSTTKQDGTSVYGGSPSCKEEVTSGTLTLEGRDFPLKVSIADCKEGRLETSVFPPEPRAGICPSLPTVEFCSKGERKVVAYSSPECGIYYRCEPEPRATSTRPIACPAVVSIEKCEAGYRRVLFSSSPECGDVYGCEWIPTATSTRTGQCDWAMQYWKSATNTCEPRANCADSTHPDYNSSECQGVRNTTGGGGGGAACDAALTSLLGEGCHYMYDDSAGNQIFCDGAMTKSAKRGATATTSGCTSPWSVATSTAPAGQREQVWNSLGLRSWVRTDADTARIERLRSACVNVSSGSSVWASGAGDSSSVDFGMPDPAKCAAAAACAAGTYYNGSSCVSMGGGPPAGGCPAGQYWYVPSGGAGYCRGSDAATSTTGGGGGAMQKCFYPSASKNGAYIGYTVWCEADYVNCRKGSKEGEVISLAGVSLGAPSSCESGWSGGSGSCPTGQYWYTPPGGGAGYCQSGGSASTSTAGGGGYVDCSIHETGAHTMDSSGRCFNSDMTKYKEPGASAATPWNACTGSGQPVPHCTGSAAQSGTPATPSGLGAAIASNGKDVTLTWSDTSANESKFKIWRRVAGSGWSFLAERASSTGGTVTYTDANVPGGILDYQVQACSDTGCSPDSNIASVAVSKDTVAAVTSGGCSVLGAGWVASSSYCLNSTRTQYAPLASPTPSSVQFCTGANAPVSGCVGPTGSGTTTGGSGGSGTPPAGQKSQTWNSRGLTSWIRTDADTARIESLKSACANVPSGSSVWASGAGDSSSVDFGMPDPAKCAAAAACAAGTYYNGTSCSSSSWSSGGSSGSTDVFNTQSGCAAANGVWSGTYCSCPSGTYLSGGFCTSSGSTTGGGSGSGWSSCSASLTALLGSGCHRMYTDSQGRAIYCDGPMTMSAREGDAATTSGCSSPSSARPQQSFIANILEFFGGLFAR